MMFFNIAKAKSFCKLYSHQLVPLIFILAILIFNIYIYTSCTGTFDLPEKPSPNCKTYYSNLNYCAMQVPLEGVWTVYCSYMWLCNCPDNPEAEDCCTSFFFPRVEACTSCLINIEGQLTFVPESVERGFFNGDLWGRNSCEKGAIQIPILGFGPYEMVAGDSYKFYFQNRDYGTEEFVIEVLSLHPLDAQIRISFPSGLPLLDLCLKYEGEAPQCPYKQEQYGDHQAFGYCFSSPSCDDFKASCMTRERCRRLGQAEGWPGISWKKLPHGRCDPLEL